MMKSIDWSVVGVILSAIALALYLLLEWNRILARFSPSRPISEARKARRTEWAAWSTWIVVSVLIGAGLTWWKGSPENWFIIFGLGTFFSGFVNIWILVVFDALEERRRRKVRHRPE